MGAECSVCGHDVFDECAWCELVAERDRLTREVERLREVNDSALRALSLDGATNWERAQAAGLILSALREPAPTPDGRNE